VICLVALLVFGVLGIFSVKYRSYAKEAFRCVSRRLTLRPCEGAFDQKLRGKITGKILKRSPALARAVHRHFEAISWTFTILLITSAAWTGYSAFNLVTFGSCDPASPGCVFSYEGSCSISCQPCDCQALGCESPEFAACAGICRCDPEMCAT
jgi:hypothetical protein